LKEAQLAAFPRLSEFIRNSSSEELAIGSDRKVLLNRKISDIS